MRLFIAAVLVVALLFQPQASAEVYEIQTEGVFEMGDDDSREYAKQKAIEDAMRNATHEAGVYVESISKISNARLSYDEINLVAASILKLLSSEITFETTPIWKAVAKITVEANTDNIDLAAILRSRKTTSSQAPNANRGGETYSNSPAYDYQAFPNPSSELAYQAPSPNTQANLPVAADPYQITGLLISIYHLDGAERFITTPPISSITSEVGETIYNINLPTPKNAAASLPLWLKTQATNNDYLYRRLGKNPLRIKALALTISERQGDFRDGIIISNQDAQNIKQLNIKYNFLRPESIVIETVAPVNWQQD